MREALLYEPYDQDRIRCHLCSHRCLIKPNETGICGVRINRDGRLLTQVYGMAISANSDPIEKKPLFHFLPGTTSFSIATVGCNFTCKFCQNHDISQMPKDQGRIVGRELLPSEIVAQARRRQDASISYTYTEPTIYFEYALDTARAAASKGLKNVFVTNGYMTEDALRMIGSDLHAANVDLKAFNPDFYLKLCQAKLEPVKESIVRMKEMGVWVEVTTLIIPGHNDNEDELTALAEWLVGISPEIPWHITRFHPTYRLLDASPTPASTIHRARKIGLEAGLHYVYSGNIWGDEGEKTYCHHCGQLLIDRTGFSISANHLNKGACPSCDTPLAGVGV
ncbi:MAG: AmmeMemoRadiSam system radical SAM enzyme [Deltaproteobacteria bacterium]|nr:AmmeMemoRadiSam system radical SAM enzyme [Deltaproteobacteria bacterium]MBW2053515.1 AmmeMemoRadiSam system radical SAM enzyme [Deltaproteobacteria bacterium]MBW2140804.1 AmmeMemoRadiSam system radical SAM enzyme [Deltaproteobacteria bacterium]MBW2323927.1 AmmeMemoRadiSam system radical SAM enzyme [Deltaproteobacteria bacterium]